MRLWQSRTWAAFTITVTPFSRTTSWLQSNFTWRKAQRDVGRSRRLSAILAPPPGVTAHSVVTTVITAPAQLFKDPDQRQLLTSGLGRIRRQQPVEICCPSSQLRTRLDHTLVLE